MIGYYVHHHGSGHRHRALTVARHLGHGITLLGSLGASADIAGPYVDLPRDDRPAPASDADVTAGGALHWAPLRHAGQQARATEMVRWLVDNRARLLVSDVSMEAVLLARLVSVPPVAVALRGDRQDRVHAAGYDAAVRILAPWTRATQHDWPERWLAKTTWTGMISRFDGRARQVEPCGHTGRCVVLLLGAGGHGMRARDLTEAAEVRDTHWHVLGAVGAVAATPRILMAGIVADPWPLLCSADVVVAAAGDAAIADVAAARAPLVAVPQDRPFREQVEHVRVLAEHHLCVPAAPWPTREHWPRLLASAQEVAGHRWAEVSDGLGVKRAADLLSELAKSPVGSRTVA